MYRFSLVMLIKVKRFEVFYNSVRIYHISYKSQSYFFLMWTKYVKVDNNYYKFPFVD